jgi:hypothetical protein
MTTGDPLNPGQLARATAALDAWFDPGPGGHRVPGLAWDQSELESMHAALEAPTADAALETFGLAPGSDLSTPEQDVQNRALMGELRQGLGREPVAAWAREAARSGIDLAALHEAAEAWQEPGPEPAAQAAAEAQASLEAEPGPELEI